MNKGTPYPIGQGKVLSEEIGGRQVREPMLRPRATLCPEAYTTRKLSYD